MSNQTEFVSLVEFYTTDPRRAGSPEADYGVHWIAPGNTARWPRWRVSYIQATGEVYAVCQRPGAMGPVRVLGIVPADEDGCCYYRTLDQILAGWADPDVSGFDLAWVTGKLAAAWTPQWQQVTCKGCSRTYQCTPADDYFGGPDGEPPATPTSGVCFTCLLAGDGLDAETTGVLVLDADGHEIDPREERS